MKKTQRSHLFESQQGLSLIELMIALGLGLFIIAGIFQVTFGSRQAFEVIQAQSMMQESGRFATHFIADTARNAGYRNLGVINAADGNSFAQALIDSVDFESNIAAAWPQESFFEEGAIAAGADNARSIGFNDAKNQSDVLSLRMQGDASDDATNFSMSDCQGSMISSAESDRTIVHYYINDNDMLVCRADQSNSGALTTGSVVELVSGVEDMEVVYGVDTFGATSFQNASAMNASDWASVRSVRVALLAASNNTPLNKGIDRRFDLLDRSTRIDGDGKARQVFYQTIALRN